MAPHKKQLQKNGKIISYFFCNFFCNLYICILNNKLCSYFLHRRESNGYNAHSQSPGRNALTLVKFAAEIMRTLDQTNLKEFNMAKEPDFRLRLTLHLRIFVFISNLAGFYACSNKLLKVRNLWVGTDI